MYSNWPREHVAGWEAAVAELRDQGWDVVLLTYEAPVQLEGTLPSGERFYFRARGNEVSLGVGGDPSDMPEWWDAELYGDEGSLAASALPSDDGVKLLHELLRRNRARQAEQAGGSARPPG